MGQQWRSKATRRTVIIIIRKGDEVMVRYPNLTSEWRKVVDIKQLYFPV
jgi:hypothetical protein